MRVKIFFSTAGTFVQEYPQIVVVSLLCSTVWLSFVWPIMPIVIGWHFCASALTIALYTYLEEVTPEKPTEKRKSVSVLFQIIFTTLIILALVAFPLFHKQASGGYWKKGAVTAPNIEFWGVISLMMSCGVVFVWSTLWMFVMTIPTEKEVVLKISLRGLLAVLCLGAFVTLSYLGCGPKTGTVTRIIRPAEFSSKDSEAYGMFFYGYEVPFKDYELVDVKLDWYKSIRRGVLDTHWLKGPVLNRQVRWEASYKRNYVTGE